MKRHWTPNPTGKRDRYECDPIAKRFIGKLFEEFQKSGQSLTDFAKTVGITKGQLSMWFNGVRYSANLTTVVNAWKKLGRSLDDDFMGGS